MNNFFGVYRHEEECTYLEAAFVSEDAAFEWIVERQWQGYSRDIEELSDEDQAIVLKDFKKKVN